MSLGHRPGRRTRRFGSCALCGREGLLLMLTLTLSTVKVLHMHKNINETLREIKKKHNRFPFM